jgi:hypothetical protein
MSDYCYCDRLLTQDTGSFFSTHGFRVLPVTAEPSGCPFFLPYGGTSGTKCHSGAVAYFPEDQASVSVSPGPKPVAV